MPIPTPEQCEQLLASNNTPEASIIHSRIVRDVARRIGRDLKWLRDRGPNMALITAAALLHDIAKGQPNHAAAGAAIVRGSGYDEVADIVAAHNDIEFSGDFPVTEKEIVFIADKLVKGDQMVTVIYMFDHKIESCTDEELLAKLKQSKEVALRIKTSIEQETGKNLEELAIAED
ncbi:HD domain-containing protein [Maridesulfovibrio salexigens]|uniref:Metal dependent phosphohydrolase n=1 Tax=Maridesulfovibrio salexigens (strain ATCC 14822 / DSM 2638 / NCIMB 8403 / VKM B-1763) TaxID=526222 RepID=C6C1G0_MARSD|nr:HD domain-containing protein [Maridesulfovibrio salexigens]ACS81135.1 metal dependent phosphohydrolase [Maridesulfovibrio salexigens DSM 2638]